MQQWPSPSLRLRPSHSTSRYAWLVPHRPPRCRKRVAVVWRSCAGVVQEVVLKTSSFDIPCSVIDIQSTALPVAEAPTLRLDKSVCPARSSLDTALSEEGWQLCCEAVREVVLRTSCFDIPCSVIDIQSTALPVAEAPTSDSTSRYAQLVPRRTPRCRKRVGEDSLALKR